MRYLLVSGLVAALSGCGAVAYMSGVPQAMTTKSVPAVYDGLPGSRLAVVVRTLEQTDWEHPELPGDLERHIAKEIRDNVPKTILAPQAEVTRYKKQTGYWAEKPELEVGRALKADLILYVSVDFYSPSQSDAMHYMQGRLTCRCVLVDCRSGEEVWAMPDLTVLYPSKSLSGQVSTSVSKNRTQLMANFSEKLVQNFYRHWESTVDE